MPQLEAAVATLHEQNLKLLKATDEEQLVVDRYCLTKQSRPRAITKSHH